MEKLYFRKVRSREDIISELKFEVSKFDNCLKSFNLIEELEKKLYDDCLTCQGGGYNE